MSLLDLVGRLLAGATPTTLLWTLGAVEFLALITLPSVLLSRRGRPTAAIAWIFAVLALPLLGSLMWWTFGRTRIERKKRKRAQRKRSYRARTGRGDASGQTTSLDRLMPERARNGSAYCSGGNRLAVSTEGQKAFAALERAIDDAEHTIHLLYYIFNDDSTGRRIAERLVAKARAGVTVRVLLDGFGSQAGTGRLRRDLTRGGVQVAIFLPSPLNPLHAPRINFTNHRKIAVFDGVVAFTGGMNIGEEYELRWRDLMMRIEGPAVAGLDDVFLEDWYFATNEAVHDVERPDRSGAPGSEVAVIASGPDTEPWIHDAYFLAITRAERRVWLVTPYFIPTPPIVTALRTAAGRGVDVRIVVPDSSDVALVKWASRSFYKPLVQAGVRIFEYEGPMLHAKAFVGDDDLLAVGSANIDSRSFGLSFEVACFAQDGAIHTALSQWVEDLMSSSVEATEEWLSRKTTLEKVTESAAHLFSPIL
ncbi:MAG TPA: cardiolipin synthase [Polyangiaceae bacterium]|nr:cardiolipin synthase [Polyangiaceae bacterium]